jgi:hypothetical protein
MRDVVLSFDDEEAGGDAYWHERTVPGMLPRAGDWVWNPTDRRHFEVVRLGWSFVQSGSVNASSGEWAPLIRVHVRPLARAVAGSATPTGPTLADLDDELYMAGSATPTGDDARG